MGENTKIEWADHTFNPWVGCTKISPACDHCYAEGWARRTGQAELWAGERRRTSESNWRQPVKWNRKAAAEGRRARVFCASLADVFDNRAHSEWVIDLWHLIRRTPALDWLLLTKRPQNIAEMLPEDWGDGYPNVWLGTTVENQVEANRRIPHLLRVPAAKRFLSCEPLLGPVDLMCIDFDGHHVANVLRRETPQEIWASDWSPCVTGTSLQAAIEGFTDDGHTFPPSNVRPPGVDWVICGGESGPGARPMHPNWARSLRDQCVKTGVPFFFKQWGEWAEGFICSPTSADTKVRGANYLDGRWHYDTVDLWAEVDNEDYEYPDVLRLGRARAGAEIDDREWREIPG